MNYNQTGLPVYEVPEFAHLVDVDVYIREEKWLKKGAGRIIRVCLHRVQNDNKPGYTLEILFRDGSIAVAREGDFCTIEGLTEIEKKIYGQ